VGSLFLIRHGQASYGQTDYDRLSPRGIEQARALGPALARMNLDAIYVGPHTRQQQTLEHAVAACDAKLPVHVDHAGLAEYPAFKILEHFIPRLASEDPRFAELATAPTPRLLDEAFKRILRMWGEDQWAAPEVERVGGFVARVTAALEHAIRTSESGARIALVTSAGPIGVAVGSVFGLPPERMVRTSVVVRNTSITELRFRRETFAWHPDQISLVTFNTTAHLSPELESDR